MARVDVTPARSGNAAGPTADVSAAISSEALKQDRDKVLPLPSWLKKAYYIFPVILYIPDAIFNFYVYSDGVKRTGNALFDSGQLVLWACVSLGVVGMAYLLSVLAPWHWGQGHRIQAFFCGLGVLVATGITTWNSLSYRSSDFTAFRTDQWAGQIWPQLQSAGISVTMVLVSIAPPFWGLFWAIVQPTETGRTLRQIQESYQEKLLRTQQEAELKAMRAEANARVRAAQLKGMAATAAAAREQAKTIFKKDGEQEPAGSADQAAASTSVAEQDQAPEADEGMGAGDGKLIPMRPFSPSREAGTRGAAAFFNHAAAASPTVRSAPVEGIAASMAQPALLGDTGSLGHRQPPTFGAAFSAFGSDAHEVDGATGTTGPRPAIRRESQLVQQLNGPAPSDVRLVLAAMQQVGIRLGKRSLTNTQWQKLLPIVIEQRNVDEQSAKRLISRVLNSEANRASQA